MEFQFSLVEPNFLSKSLNTVIVANFRDNDIKMKGQGAPLVPIFHQSQFSEKNKKYNGSKYWWNYKFYFSKW